MTLFLDKFKHQSNNTHQQHYPDICHHLTCMFNHHLMLNDIHNKQVLTQYIREIIKYYEPRLTVINVTIDNKNNTSQELSIHAYINHETTEKTIKLTFDQLFTNHNTNHD